MKTFLPKIPCVFVLFFCVHMPCVQAQIIYTDVIPDSVFSVIGTVSLDLNKDGMMDFKLITNSKAVPCGRGKALNKYLRITPLDTGNAVLNYSNLPAALSLNTTIDSSSQFWKHTASQIMAADTYRCSNWGGFPSVANGGSGNFRNTTNKCLAVRFYAGKQLYYGWIRFTITSNVIVTLKDYAYQSSGKQSILMGQTSDNDIFTLASKVSQLCAGDSMKVGYSIAGNFDTANVVNVELSDSIGNFNKGTVIGSYKANISGIIPCKIPMSISGTGFRYRVTSSNPARIAVDNGTNLMINRSLPDTLITPGKTQVLCGGSVVLTAPSGIGTTYQWKKDNVNLTGSVAKTYTAGTSGLFSCAVSNGCGMVQSNAVSLTFLPLPAINIKPSDVLTKCWNLPLVVQTDSIAGYQYQWYNGSNQPIAGANKPSFSPPVGGYYSITVTAQNNCKSSRSITVYPGFDSAYIIPSGSRTINSGDSAMLQSSTIDPNLSYQWYRNGVSIPLNATKRVYAAKSSGTYTLKVDDPGGCSQTTVSSLILKVLTSAVPEIDAALSTIKVQPNPFSNKVFISFSFPDKQNFSVRIVDVAGRLVKTIASDVPGGGRFEYQWMTDDQNGNPISAGLYFLKVEAASFSQTEKLILVR